MPKASGPQRRSAAPTIEWSARALRDLDAIEQFIAADDATAANRWVLKLIATAERAAKVPTAGRVVPEKGRSDVREVRLKRYRIVYAVVPNGIRIITVFEGHKLLTDETQK